MGVGIDVSPNATGLLLRCDLGPALRVHAAEHTTIVVRRCDTGERAAYTRWVLHSESELRNHRAVTVYYQINRADYHVMLRRLACMTPSERVRRGATVCDVQPDPAVAGGPSITLAYGEVFYADLIVGVDGVKSALQKAVTGLDDRATPTGDDAYRAVVSAGLMFGDPELLLFVERLETIGWMAPGCHQGAHCIATMARESIFRLHPKTVRDLP